MTHTEERLLPQNKAYYTTTTYRIYQKSNERVGRGMNELSLCNMGRAGGMSWCMCIPSYMGEDYKIYWAWENASSTQAPTHQDTTPRLTHNQEPPTLYLPSISIIGLWFGAGLLAHSAYCHGPLPFSPYASFTSSFVCGAGQLTNR